MCVCVCEYVQREDNLKIRLQITSDLTRTPNDYRAESLLERYQGSTAGEALLEKTEKYSGTTLSRGKVSWTLYSES